MDGYSYTVMCKPGHESLAKLWHGETAEWLFRKMAPTEKTAKFRYSNLEPVWVEITRT